VIHRVSVALTVVLDVFLNLYPNERRFNTCIYTHSAPSRAVSVRKKTTKPRSNDISTVREALMWTEVHLHIAQSL
jgi:hypothetical protein